MQYTTGEEERVRCYANNAYNPGGGTHLSGFRTALTRDAERLRQQGEPVQERLTPIGEDFREGLTAIVSVTVPEPQFESQTKIRLNNPEVEGIVASVVNEVLVASTWRRTPRTRKKIMKKVILAAEAREAAAKAKKALKDRKSILSGGGLPGKLMDCTSRDRDEIGAVPRRGRLRRRLGRERPRSALPGHPAAARQGAQRREGPPRKAAATTRRSAASSPPSASTSATPRTSASCATARSSS